MKWECLSKEYVLNNRWLRVRKDSVSLPSKVILNDYYVIEKNDVCLIIPVTSDNKVLLKREYRYPVDLHMIELPGGTMENILESALEVAQRELLEETGYTSQHWKSIGVLYDYPTKDTNKINLFVAEKIEQVSLPKTDYSENIEFSLYEMDEVWDMVMNGSINVSGSVAALLKYMNEINYKKNG
jgi:ADP-ribose pyrophosphatase